MPKKRLITKKLSIYNGNLQSISVFNSTECSQRKKYLWCCVWIFSLVSDEGGKELCGHLPQESEFSEYILNRITHQQKWLW